MRTAIVLLLLLGAGAAVGSLFPQRPIDPSIVEAWIERNGGWAWLAEKLGLFDVFGSWWFMAIYGLLLVSLVGCLVPRYRAWVRAMRQRPRARTSLDSAPHYTAGRVALPPEAVLDGAARALRSRRWRLVREDSTIAGEKGHLREGGSLVFHTAFLVLLVGMSAGKLLGHSGQVAVIEGERFTDTHIDYDYITEGRFFGERHSGLTLALDAFDVTWHPNGVPRDFVSRVRLLDGDRVVRTQDIHVNSPLTYGGTRFYQLSWGWAPEVRVEQRGRVLYDAPTVFLPRGTLWRGVVKVPGARPQVGLDMLFFTDPAVGPDGTPNNVSPEPRQPLIVFQSYSGDLGLTVPQSVFDLDTTLLVAEEAGAIGLGESIDLPNGVRVTFSRLRQYSVFQVATNPGAPILLAAAVMILVGLVPALYSSRRRVWVRAAPSEGAARIEIAGHAMQRAAAFEEEFRSLVRTIDESLTTRGSEPVKAGHGGS